MPQVDLAQLAFEAFQRAESAEAMQQAVARFPLMTGPDLIAAIEHVIDHQVPPEHQPAFEQRLAWLCQIVDEHWRTGAKLLAVAGKNERSKTNEPPTPLPTRRQPQILKGTNCVVQPRNGCSVR